MFDQGNQKILDLRRADQTNHPMVFRYTEVFSAALVTGNICDGRIQPGVAIYNHPFTIAARALVNTPLSSISAEDEPYRVLDRFYTNFQPRTARQWFGLSAPCSNLDAWEAFQAVPPWRARSHHDYGKRILQSARREASINGFLNAHSLDERLLWGKCGPVSREIVMQELKRLTYLTKNIAKHGYIRNDEARGDVKATALVRSDGEWRWVVTSGYHRACVACALNFPSLPVRVSVVVHETETKYWPHVLSHSFSTHEASQVFEIFYEGNHHAFE